MTVDMEARLREALHARAAQVTPDAGTWELVQARLRRSRQRRVLVAVAAVAAVVAVAAVAVPAMLGTGVITFDDPPVADQPKESSGRDPSAPPAEEAEPPAVADVEPCHEPSSAAAVWSTAGDLWGACAAGGVLPLTTGPAADTAPVVSPAGDAVVFQRLEQGAEHPVIVHRELGEDGAETVLGGGGLPALSAEGRLARVLDAGDGTSLVHVGEPFAEPEQEAGLQAAAQDVRSLEWDPAAERLLYAVEAAGDIAVGVLEPGAGQSRVVLEAGQGYLAAALSPDGATLAALRRDGGGGVDLVAFDRSVLDGAQQAARTIASGLPLAAPDGRRAFVASAGLALAEPGGPGGALDWRPATEPSWFVGDGEAFHLVEGSGRVVTLDGGADGAARNPAVELDDSSPGATGDASTGGQLRAGDVAQELRAAAEDRDMAALRSLMAPEFTFSFGQAPDPDAAITYFEQNPAVLDRLRRLLELPHGVVEGEAELYVWPRAHALAPSEWTADDVADLRSIGATDEQIGQWRQAGAYLGLRTGIDGDGRWVFLVEGD